MAPSTGRLRARRSVAPQDARAGRPVLWISGAETLHPHPRQAVINKSKILSGRPAQINDPPFDEGAAVIDPHQHALPGVQPRYAGQRTQRQGTMGGGQRMLVKNFTAGGQATVEGLTIPAGQPRLFAAHLARLKGVPRRGRGDGRAGGAPRLIKRIGRTGPAAGRQAGQQHRGRPMRPPPHQPRVAMVKMAVMRPPSPGSTPKDMAQAP